MDPNTPFSGAVLVGDTLFLSGQDDADPVSGNRSDNVDARTRQAMDRIGTILENAGLNYSHLVNCRLYLADMDDYPTVNAAYASYLTEARYPARTTVEVVGLPGGGSIQVACIAYGDSAATKVVQPPADEIPAPMGPYSPAVMAGGTLYLSGQGGRDPLTSQLSDQASEQADVTIKTIGTILRAADLGFENVVTAYSFLPGAADAAAVQARLSALFPAGGAPTGGQVPVGRLPGDIAVEITFSAVQDPYAITRLHPTGETPNSSSSPAVLAGDIVYLEPLAMPGPSLREQFQAILARHESILALADLSLTDVVYADLFLADLQDADDLEGLFREAFPGERPPAATVIGVGPSAGARVMVGLVAAR